MAIKKMSGNPQKTTTMKKMIKQMALMACGLLLLSLSSCERDGEELTYPSTGKLLSFVVSASDSGEDGVRAELLEDGTSVKWSSEEKMGVFYALQPTGGSNSVLRRNACYMLSSSSEDGLKATFSGDIEWSAQEGTHKLQIYYPYHEEVTSSSAGYGTLPSEQRYDPAGWDISEYDFMVSGTASTKEVGVAPTIKLKHLFSILRLNITNATDGPITIERVKLTSTSGLILSGEFQANIGKSDTAEALHNATSVTNTDGYFTSPSSSVATTLVRAEAIEPGEAMDVRLMINAGLVEGSEEYYLAGETLEIEIHTTGNPVWKSEFTGGNLARGARAVKRLSIMGFDTTSTSVSQITPDHDATSNRFYLNTVATATGSNLSKIERLTVGGEEVSSSGLVVEEQTIRFRIPDTISLSEAASCVVVGYDAEDNAYELGEVMVYPFFYYKGVRLGLGSNSNSTYTQYASENAMFVPDLGRVLSAEEWRSRPIDSFVVEADDAGAAANPALSAKNTLDKSQITSAEYYATMPYYFFVASSEQKLSMAAPSNSNSVLRNHHIYNNGKYTNLLSNKLYGTPIIWYRVLGDDNSWAKAVKEGTLTSIAAYNATRPSATTPYFGTATVDGDTWSEGAVILTGYTSYAKGAKPSNLKDYAKLGFIHIREITCADKSAGLALSPREGYIEFDFYWSKPLNDTADIPLYGDDSEALAPAPTPTPPTDEGREAGTYIISSAAELEALTPLQDGDRIIWRNGTYADVTLTLKSDEEINNGITFSAESNGGVIFTGASTLQVNTSKTSVEGFHWQDPVIEGEHLVRFYTGTEECRMEECMISGSNTTAAYDRSCKWLSLNGSNHTVENCTFTDKRDRGALLVVWFDEGITPSHTIKNNYFSRPSILIDPADGDPANEQETIRIGDSSASLNDGDCLVEGNYFYRCWGESAEVVSNKSCANRYAGNYFEECRGTLTLRHGNNCTVEGNYFFGNGVEESGGVRVIGQGHTVRGNHFEALAGIGYKAALSLVRGQENASLSGYAQVDNALIENNIFKECVLAVHANYGGSNMTLPVIGTVMRNNTLVSTNTSNYIVRYESSTPEAEITWEGNTLYGKFKNNYFSLTSLKTAPNLEDISTEREAVAAAAGVSWSL